MTQEVKTQSEMIWDEIKELPLEMFALPAQQVSDYFQKVEIEPNKCYLTMKIASALPALETAFEMKKHARDVPLKNKYQIEQVDRFVVISPIQRLGQV